MELWKELLSSDVGIMSAIVIATIIGMAGYYAWYFHKMVVDAEKIRTNVAERLAVAGNGCNPNPAAASTTPLAGRQARSVAGSARPSATRAGHAW